MRKTTVFLDWVNTLVRMEPDRHTMCVEALREVGIEIDAEHALRGILAAEGRLPEGRPIQWAEDDDHEAFLRYNDIMMRSAGLEPLNEQITMTVVRRVRQMAKSARFIVFDDVRPSLQRLRQLGFTTAIISNMNRPLQPLVERLGLGDIIDFSITSSEVGGASKPEQSIFHKALERAGARPEEAVHVGDEPWVDYAGALRAGITPVLIERQSLSHGDTAEYTHISSLEELPALLQSLSE